MYRKTYRKLCLKYVGNLVRSLHASVLVAIETSLPELPFNTVIGCGYIPPPDNGFKEGDIYLVGHTVTFVCDSNFVLRGSSRRTCEEQGQWSGNVTACSKYCTYKVASL